ncbi:MerR family transcriptional regulator [Kineococcus sp. NUM-3379]
MSSPSGADASEQPRVTLTVAAVARRLGVAPATLRTWDRRYGVGPSEHTAGAHRRYSASDLARLVVMRRLTLEGVAPAEAAALATAATDAGAGPGAALAGASSVPRSLLEAAVSDAAAVSRTVELEGEDAADDPPGEAREARREGRQFVLPLDAPSAVRELLRSADALEEHETAERVTAAVHEFGTARAWDEVLAPVLAAVGPGRELVLTCATAVLRQAAPVVAAAAAASGHRCALVATCEEETQGLPVLAVAAALAEAGVGSRSLGARVPRRAVAAAVRRTAPPVLVLHAQDAEAAPAQLEELLLVRPAPLVLLSGPGWTGVPRGGQQAGTVADVVRAAVDAVRR